jgi:hypothetical protein
MMRGEKRMAPMNQPVGSRLRATARPHTRMSHSGRFFRGHLDNGRKHKFR